MGNQREVRPRSPKRWATDISAVLNAVQGMTHFPISVTEVALELSRHWFPDDPLSLIQGESLPGFDGALLPAPSGKAGWGIFYNSCIKSTGRINFTLAHEFGHYLIHRLAFPDGLQCNQGDVIQWDPTYKAIENEANTFAAYFLMPLDDYRRQLSPTIPATYEALAHCAQRYDVSLSAATLRWLLYTERRAVLVVSRDGFILWARSSTPAFRSGIYIKTAGRTIEVPKSSVAACPELHPGARLGISHPPGVWFPEPCQEIAIASENYNFTFSLIQFPPSSRAHFTEAFEVDATETLGDKIRRKHGL